MGGELGVAQKVSFSYSDSCLVGASVKAGGKDAGKAVQALAKVLRSAAVTEQELTGAKKALVMASEERASNPASLGSLLGTSSSPAAQSPSARLPPSTPSRWATCRRLPRRWHRVSCQCRQWGTSRPCPT